MKSKSARKNIRDNSATGASVALGLRAHSGWAALVVVAGTPRSPRVIDRRIIKIADPQIPGSKQPYHAAESLPLAKAEEYLNRCINRTRHLAQESVREVVDDLRKRGHDLVGCGILTAADRPLPGLAEILASHPLLHTAEGELYRNALIEASEECGLPVRRVPERELFSLAVAELHMSAEKLRNRVTELGQSIGPPWTQDEKYAALLAWMLLATASRRPARSSKRAK